MANKKQQIIVIGGGAAGIVAAITARRLGAQVTILERNSRIGKKILATGNGRCNYTNINTNTVHFYGKHPYFTNQALTNFSAHDTISFFEKLGIVPKVEEGGKVFPRSEQASSFLDVFLYELKDIGVNVVCDAYVKKVGKKNNEFIIELDNGTSYTSDKVIITTGGKAMPSSGSDGNGYDLALKLGHNITEVFPSLVQIMLEGTFFKRIEGVKLIGTAELIIDNKAIAMERGDILFANYGVSGPPILQLSRLAGEFLNEGRTPFLKINILDSMSNLEVVQLINKRIELNPHKPLDFSLIGLINKRLIPVVLNEAGFKDIKLPAVSLSAQDIEAIANIMTGWLFKIRGTKGWTSAQVTAGGVDTAEVHADTMESKLVENLFFAGEILDIDGQCGGFNLQWAWSSGYVAGQNAAL